jgi:hypothetical protein
MPSADFCCTVRMDYSTLSPDSGTCNRSPAIRMTAVNAQPPNLPPALLMDVDFAVIGQLVQRCRPHIRFLSIGSRLCSTLPSDPASRRRPCASLSLLLHQDVKGTCTPKLTIMHGVPGKLSHQWCDDLVIPAGFVELPYSDEVLRKSPRIQVPIGQCGWPIGPPRRRPTEQQLCGGS